MESVDSGNTYIGGQGNDIIYDTSHSDTIIYNIGDGHDILNMTWVEENVSDDGMSLRKDIIQFGEGISSGDLTFEINGNSLLIKILEGTENEGSLYFSNWFGTLENSEQKVEYFNFVDGNVLSWLDISKLANPNLLIGDASDNEITGTENNDTLIGAAGNDTLYGELGDDTLIGSEGDDIINGNDGNDLIKGGYGNDILNGGNGDDTIEDWNGLNTISGGAGNDNIQAWNQEQVIVDGGEGNDNIYTGEGNDIIEGGLGDDIIYSGYGDDTITDQGGSNTISYEMWSGNDTIELAEHDSIVNINTLNFGWDIYKESLAFEISDNSLIIRIMQGESETGSVTIKDWFMEGATGGVHSLEQFQFFDGSILTAAEITSLAETAQAELDAQAQFDLLSQEMASFSADSEDSDLTGFTGTDNIIYQE